MKHILYYLTGDVLLTQGNPRTIHSTVTRGLGSVYILPVRVGNSKMATNVDYEFVEELQDELMCSICMKVLNEPQMVNCCEQRFCKNCLTK